MRSTPTEGTNVINHTYGVAEESGSWYLLVDGEITRTVAYRTSRAAQRVADKLTATANLWRGVFDIETKVAEALMDESWPYGATCVNHGTVDNPSWLLTEPYRVDEEAVRIVHPDPTGYVQINVYNRDLYEAACRAAGITPDTDETITAELSKCRHSPYVPEDIEPIEAVKIRLAYRRSLGINVETAADRERRVEQLEKAGLVIDRYTRDQYTAACKIMGVDPLDEHQVMLVLAIDVATDMGIGVISPDIPHDPITINLAYRRAMGTCGDDVETSGDDAPDNDR
jgi:hypothetical protein